MPKIGSGGGGSRLYGWYSDTWSKLQLDANKFLKVVLQAASVVMGKVRLVTATGDEVTDDTADAVKVQVSPVPSVTVLRAAISAASSGDNTLVAAAASGLKIKVLGMILIGAGDVDVAFESGAGGTALTGDMSLAADGNGFVLPVAPIGYHWFETAAATLLNLELSAAVQVSGCIVYHVEA